MNALARTEAGAQVLVKVADEGKFPEELKLAAATALARIQYAGLKDAIAKNFPEGA